MDLKNGIFTGIILDMSSDTYPTNYFVKIPELLNSGEQLMVRNNLNTFVAVKEPSMQSTTFSGSYTPLVAGTKVNIVFAQDDLQTGSISSIHYDSQAIPPGQPSTGYYLIAETPNGSRIYVDEYKNRMHLTNAGGLSDIFMNEDTIILQTNSNERESKIQSSLELSKNGFKVKFGDKSFGFNDSGLHFNQGENGNTFFNMTEKGISMKGEEFISIDTEKLNIRGEMVNLQSNGNFNIRGTVLNLTGTQKASMSSSVVAIEGWLSTYLKAGLTLNLDSKVFYRQQCLINEETNLAVKHTFAPVSSTENLMSAETSTFKATAIGTMANDGVIINNIGVASAIAPSLATSMIGINTSLHLAFAGFGTFLSLDNIASSVVGTVLTDTMVASSAGPATTDTSSIMGMFGGNEESSNFLNKLHTENNLFKSDYNESVRDYSRYNNPTMDNTLFNNELKIISSNLFKENL